VEVWSVKAYENRGDPRNHSYSTGSGIILAGVKNGMVSWSAAYDNGGAGGASEGPEGIWAYNSTQVAIEHDISYDNRTRDQLDGNGFGLDQNTSNSFLQYDLSYGNDGAGYLVYSDLPNGLERNNVVRFDISSGDGLGGNPNLGEIDISGFVSNSAVYQNTAVAAASSNGFPALALRKKIRQIIVCNNIFTSQDGPIISTNFALSTSDALLQANDYYTSSSDWSILWGQASYPSLAVWRSATGQETTAGKPIGFAIDPQLTGPFLGLRVKTVGEAEANAGFTLRRGSPLVGAGLNLSQLFGLHPISRNYSGRQVSMRFPNVGAE
jgi:hypothetical protein